MGLDPVLDKIPLEGKPEYRIKKFYSDILEALIKRSVFPAAVKPNIAFYEGVGLDCLWILKELVADYRREGMLVILDAKRGDIGKTSGAYAQMAFEVYGADAVTVHPYMGSDSVRPFQEASSDQGVYVLVRTSNPSATDFEDVMTAQGHPLYLEVAHKVAEWNDGNLGAVVGATSPRELETLLQFWKKAKADIPCLIPGISLPGVEGGQGGSARDILEVIKASGSDPRLHLINSSSGLNYAYQKFSGEHYAKAACIALEELIVEMQG